MFGTILFRMILWELTKVFVISLVGITGLLLMAGIIAEASQQGLGPAQILAAIPLLIPSTLPYTIPATTLFATCVVYGRLAADNEVLAIKASGVNVLNVVTPGVILGLTMSLATLGLYYRVIPYTHYLLRAMVFHDAEEFMYSILRRHGTINHPSIPYSMFVKGVQGKKLTSPVFKRRNAKGVIDVVANAKEADLRVDMAHKLVLIHMRHGDVIGEDGVRAYFIDKYFEVPLPKDFGTHTKVPARDMTWKELRQKWAEYEQLLAEARERTEAAAARLALSGQPADLPVHVRNLQNQEREIRNKIRFLYVEMLMRPALSFGCLVFILVGCPIGIMFSRSDYLGAFMTCFLPIVIVYYPLMLAGTNLAKDGKVNEILLVFAADAVIAACGVVLLRFLARN